MAKVAPETADLVLAGCNGRWVKVIYKTFTGWLDEDSRCGNPVTNCN